jgi:HEAT repeat protein
MSNVIAIVLIVIVCFAYLAAEFLGITILEAILGPIFDWMGLSARRSFEWFKDRSGMADPDQSAYVRVFAKRLGSRVRTVRLIAADRLKNYNDKSAVPALIKGVRKYREDGPLIQEIVRALAHLGDGRAVPVLRELEQHSNQNVVEVARSAIAAIEPKTLLLRPSGASAQELGGTLVRAAQSGDNSTQDQLLRVSSD